MKKLFNIFSKSSKRKNQKPELKILADFREKNSLVISELISFGCKVEFKNLPVADFLVGKTAIERKTSSDFINSMISKRLFNQLNELKQYKNNLLIIEGNLEETDFSNPNALKGCILSILLEHKVPILYSKNPEETALFLHLLSKKQKREISLRAVKSSLNKKEQLQFILEGFPGIGPVTAKKLLKKYKTLKNILLSDLEELKSEIGKKAGVFSLLNEKY